MKHITRLTIVLLAALLVQLLAPLTISAQEDTVPWPTEGWQTSTPEEQGMDSELLAEMMDYLQEQNSFNIHSLLIIRHGYIVTDAYFYPFAQGYLHDLASVTKSFTSTLIGIAIDEGYIESVQQPILDFFPERSVANVDADKEAMTLEDLLTMHSGFECSNQGNNSTDVQMGASPDWVQFSLDLPMAVEPGTRYNYCNQNAHLLSAIIQETTGVSALSFAQEHLFGPLGISDVIWPIDPQGNNRGWEALMLAPHDMAKLGYLFLNEGLWDGQQVVSTAWVEMATSALTPAVGGSDYGYLWWVNPASGYYEAAGDGGQEMYVLPDQNMVVVMTGSSGGGGPGAWGERVLNSYILPTVVSESPLSTNPDGMALLEDRVQQVVASPPPEPVPPMPEIAQQVSGQTIVMDSNPFGLLSGSLTFQEGEAEAVLNLTFSAGPDEALVVEWLIGLDNVFRFSSGLSDFPVAAIGWWESDIEFVIYRVEVGGRDWIEGHYQEQIIMTFEVDQVTLQIADITLVGRLEE